MKVGKPKSEIRNQDNKQRKSVSPFDFRLPDSDLCVAVSGGADSMALLHMLATQKRPHQTLIALTVDHGLRAESVQEAADVARYCQTLGIAHHVLRWQADKPRTAVQNKARQARRRLLLDTCKERGIADLYLAHQADDQIETVLQRLARGSGPAGLSGMKARAVQRGIILHRPLLAVRRADLRAYCVQNGVPFHDDPSNDDTHFERVRWRQIVQQIERTEPHFVKGMRRFNKRMQDAAQAITHQAETWVAENCQTNDGVIRLPRSNLTEQPHAVIVEILRSLLTTGRDYKLDLERLEIWVEQACHDSPTETALTLDGWWLQIKRDWLVIQPAPARKSAIAS